MAESPRVFIVLVNFKSWPDTIECLESLFKLSYSNLTVVIIDNDSRNGSIDHLKNWAAGSSPCPFQEKFYSETQISNYPIKKPIPYHYFKLDQSASLPIPQSKLIFIESEQNLGFAGGNNIGIRLALESKADYVWLLNNDTVVTGDSLTNLVRHFKKANHSGKRLGILGAKLLYYHNPTLIQAILGRYKPLLASTEHIGLNQHSNTLFSELNIRENDYVVGASMFVSTKFIQEVGLMSEEYFLYFEEIDWVKRGQIKGYEIDVCLNALIYHKEGASIGGGIKDNNNKSTLSDYYSIRNRLIITRKYYSKCLLPVYLSLIFVAANRIKRKQFSRLPLLFRAIKSSTKNTT